jgi:pimeloyl-ACP methyl ester carboxylesterase
MEFTLSLAKIALVVYALLCLLLVLLQAGCVYYPDRNLGATPSHAGLEYEDLMLETHNGEQVSAWYVPAGPDPSVGHTILFCHGNAGNISHRLGSIATFRKLNLHVLIFDYQGYGKSTGKPSEKGTYADARAAWEHLIEDKKVPSENIIIFGRSLGGAVATQLASTVTPGALVLESAFTSAPDMAHQMFPILPTRLLCRFKYDNLRLITGIKCPIVIAHGQQDQTVPYSHSQKLFKKAPEPKRFIQIRGNHNDGGMDTDLAYREEFKKFLASLEKTVVLRD